MAFRVSGLSPEPFRHLYGQSDAELAKHGAKRYVVDTPTGYPDRIEMRDVISRRNDAPDQSCFADITTHPIARATRSSCARVPKRLMTGWTRCRTSFACGSVRCAPSTRTA